MPATPLKHFEEDLARSQRILALASKRPSGTPKTATLRDDLMRSSWMFAVGAFDAYFCDAYADLLARILRAKNLQHDLQLSNSISKIDLPVGAIFSPAKVRHNWRWRLAARGLIEKDNVLSVAKIKQLFNPFMAKGSKLFQASVVDTLVRSHRAPIRMVGITATDYSRLTGAGLSKAREATQKRLAKRITEICQRRHDCIHNCDRPKLALQRMNERSVQKVINDIGLLIRFFNSHIEKQFNQYLATNGANAKTRNSAGY